MEVHAARIERPPTRRRVLQDSTSRVNNEQPRSQTGQTNIYSSVKAVECEANKENGGLRVRNGSESPLSSMGNANVQSSATNSPNCSTTVDAENQHLQVVNDHQESNRDSQISNVSNMSGKSRRKTHVGPWRLGRTLGRGASGRVRLAKHAVTGQYAAVKIVSKGIRGSASLATKEMMEEAALKEGERRLPFGIEREVVIMKLIEHPNVMRLYDVWENRGELYLVLEFVEGGELFDFIVQRGRLPEHEAVEYFRQMLSGLSYCHRFGICHRDLKPENILLDKEHNTIKLADFGMAALQPAGSLLNTFCGSPHYASPEIVKAMKYNGEKTDIWSCGIILFVLLTGRLPFDEENVRRLLKKVAFGRYIMPTGLSEEAKDLIFRMLQVDPGVRISMDEIWEHPLMHKYEVVGGPAGGRSLAMDRWGGAPPPPTPQQVGRPVKGKDEIDAEILRNLCTLWHGEKEEVIVQRLLSREPNQEKVFYCLLMKYRNDHLENYQGPGLEYSSSDYHHHKPPPPRALSSRQLHSQRGHNRKPSQFSILSDDKSRPRASYYQDPVASETVESYDPFRPSLNLEVPPAEYANVTVLRGQPSNASRQRGASVRVPTGFRVQALQQEHRVNSRVSIASSRIHGKRRTETRRYASRSSVASSTCHSSSPIVVRPSDRHKRNIDFSQARKSSAVTQLREQQNKPQPLAYAQKDYVVEGSPSPDVVPIPKSSRLNSRNSQVAAGQRGGRTISHIFKEEARQVSNELEKFCDEAFNRSSVASTVRTGNTSRLTHVYESPVSSFTSREGASSRLSNPKPMRMHNISDLDSRPLPAPPTYEDDSREDIRYQNRASGNENQRSRKVEPNGYLEDVIAHLDKLIQPNANGPAGRDGRRIASATPDCRSPEGDGYMPAITEEGRYSDADEFQALLEKGHNGYRSIPAPLQNMPMMSGANEDAPGKNCPAHSRYHTATVRMVEKSSPGPEQIMPLVIRKKTPPTPSTEDFVARDRVGSKTWQKDTESVVCNLDLTKGRVQFLRRASQRVKSDAFKDESLEGSQQKRDSAIDSVDTRRRGWFKRTVSKDHEDIAPLPPAKDDWPLPPLPESPVETRPPILKGSAKDKKPVIPGFEKDGSHAQYKSWSGTKGFFKMFKRESKKQQGSELAVAGRISNSFDDTVSNNTSVSGEDRQLGSNLAFASGFNMRATRVPQQNWFARIFHIKPASRIVCFSVTKRTARKEIVTLLRDWKRYGMRDVVVDKVRNVVRARVDATNFLRIKEVSFVVEVMTVIEHGQRFQLSIARFTQEQGAASSLHRVVDTLENVLRGLDILVRDEKQRRLMVKMLS